jgi:predicted ATPase
VIEARLGQLSPQAHELVNVAAVIGRAFSLELLTQASQRDEEVVLGVLDELWQRHIVGEQEAQ